MAVALGTNVPLFILKGLLRKNQGAVVVMLPVTLKSRTTQLQHIGIN